MKTKVKRLSKRTLAVFLGVMMLLTSLGLLSIINVAAKYDTHFELWTHNGNTAYGYAIDTQNDSNTSQYYVDAYIKKGWTFDLDNAIGSGGTQYGNNNGSDYWITSNLTYNQFDNKYQYNGKKWYWNGSDGVVKRFWIDEGASEWYPRVWMSDSPMDTTTLYVKGSFNNWAQDDSYKMTGSGNSCSVSFVIPGSSTDYEFKLQNVSSNDDGYIFDTNAVTFSGSSSYSDTLRSGSLGNNMKLDTINTSGNVKVTMTYYKEYSGKPRLVVEQEEIASEGYYLTGWLNGASETGNTHAFTNTSGTTWTYSFTPSRDEGGYQYMTIKKSDGTVYHPGTHGSGSGTASASTDTDASADNKWKVKATSGQTVNLTWDSSTNVLSWTVSGSGGGGSSSWKPDLTGYKADNDDVNYRLFTSIGSETFGSNTTTYDSIMHSGNKYWIEFNASQLASINSDKSNWTKFYCALSNSSSYGNIATGSATISVTNCDTTNLVNAGGSGQQSNGLSQGNDRKYARVEFKSSRTENVTGFGVLIDASTWNSPTYTFYTNTVGSDGGDDEVSTVKIYAKDGAAPIDWSNKTSGGASNTSGTAYNYAAIATTAITKIDNAAATGVTTNNVGDESSQYQSATVEVGKKLTITTTISSSNSWRTKYYVKGWCINGVTYKCDGTVGVNTASDTSTSTGVCTLNYTIPEEVDVDYLEITPIYYLRTNTNCITFYLEGYNTVQTKWGNTPYIYPFYGNNDNVDNSFGCYPGQPMVYANGQYSVEIPLASNNILNANNKNGTAIKGVTISNGYADHVHRNMIYGWTAHDNDADHKQTYDYDDFYKIYEECLKNGTEHPNSIIFRIQDEETVYNRSAYGGGKSGQFASGTSNINISTIANSGNGWELLTNRYDEAVNIFGSTTGITKPSSSTTPANDTANAIYVVSTGYNANIAGDYGTMWKIYNGSGQLISKDTTNSRYGIPPSVLVMQGSTTGITNKTGKYPDASHSVDGVGSYTDKISQYESIYKTLKGASYVNKRVYITYEKDAQDTRSDSNGTGAYRLDGRWYYTHASDYVQSTIGIEYYDKSTAKWVTDTVTASTGKGSTSGCTAKFDSDSYSSSNNVTTSSSKLISSGSTWNFTAAAGSGYMFDSWQIKYSDTSYDKIEGAGASASVDATANYTLVARFVPIVTGDLTIDHTLASASTGEGDVDMEVKVKNGNTVLETYTGSHIYIDEYISNSYSSYTIDVTLKTTPQYDGKVSAFGYDKFNTNKNITATTSPETLPGSENTLTTSHFTFTVGDLYAGTTITTTSLAYTSTITETPHYYNFKYNFTDRSGTSKSYTAKGTISQKEYKANVNNPNDHSLNTSFVVSKAPFESNFLKKNKLTAVTPSYNSTNHTFSATSTFNQTEDVPTYHVIFELPYNYYTDSSGGTSYKKYNADGTTYNSSKATFDLAAKYNTFVTIEATSTAPDTTQNKVAKVADAADVNHTGNNFLTAPDTLTNGTKTMYFKYWEVHKGDTADGDVVTKIYYPDFNYRVYSNYYVEAVYSDKKTDSWKLNYSDTDDDSCSIIYLGDSRNQWNNGAGATSDSQTDASDLIYNDFILKYNNSGKELKGLKNVEVGMLIERVKKDGTWVKGSASVTDMSSYKTSYDSSKLTSFNGTATSGTIKIELSTDDLNNKNFMEQSYSAYSQYGQTVEDNSISFAKDSAMDDYVYRAYAYMKYDSDEDGTADTYVLSDPEYFCMKYTSSLKYSE